MCAAQFRKKFRKWLSYRKNRSQRPVVECDYGTLSDSSSRSETDEVLTDVHYYSDDDSEILDKYERFLKARPDPHAYVNLRAFERCVKCCQLIDVSTDNPVCFVCEVLREIDDIMKTIFNGISPEKLPEKSTGQAIEEPTDPPIDKEKTVVHCSIDEQNESTVSDQVNVKDHQSDCNIEDPQEKNTKNVFTILSEEDNTILSSNLAEIAVLQQQLAEEVSDKMISKLLGDIKTHKNIVNTIRLKYTAFNRKIKSASEQNCRDRSNLLKDTNEASTSKSMVEIEKLIDNRNSVAMDSTDHHKQLRLEENDLNVVTCNKGNNPNVRAQENEK